MSAASGRLAESPKCILSLVFILRSIPRQPGKRGRVNGALLATAGIFQSTISYNSSDLLMIAVKRIFAATAGALRPI